MDIVEQIFHKKELKRLRLENEDLLNLNKKLANQVRLKAIEIKKMEKQLQGQR